MPAAAPPPRRRRVGVLGCGALGEHMMRSIAGDAQARFELAFAWNRGAARLDALVAQGLVPPAARCGEAELDALADAGPAGGAAAAAALLARFGGVDVVVEVSHPDVSARVGAALLAAGCDFVCGSPTAFADGALLAAMLAASRGGGGGGGGGGGALYVPSGALWGAQDLAKLSARGGLAFLEVTMRKHPASLKLAPGALRDALDAFVAAGAAGECVLYEGPVRALCPLAPNNVNTMAAAAVAAHDSLGFDGVSCRLVADASLQAHVITVDARGRPPAPAAAAAAAPARPFRAFTERYSPAAPGAVSSAATFDAFFSSLCEARGRGPGLHMV